MHRCRCFFFSLSLANEYTGDVNEMQSEVFQDRVVGESNLIRTCSWRLMDRGHGCCIAQKEGGVNQN